MLSGKFGGESMNGSPLTLLAVRKLESICVLFLKLDLLDLYGIGRLATSAKLLTSSLAFLKRLLTLMI